MPMMLVLRPASYQALAARNAGILSGTGQRAPSRRGVPAKSLGGIAMTDLASPLLPAAGAGRAPVRRKRRLPGPQPPQWRVVSDRDGGAPPAGTARRQRDCR